MQAEDRVSVDGSQFNYMRQQTLLLSNLWSVESDKLRIEKKYFSTAQVPGHNIQGGRRVTRPGSCCWLSSESTFGQSSERYFISVCSAHWQVRLAVKNNLVVTLQTQDAIIHLIPIVTEHIHFLCFEIIMSEWIMIYEYFFTFIKFVTLKHLFYNIFIYLYHVIYFSLNLCLTW